MNWGLLALFAVLTVLNVILQTTYTIVVVKCNRLVAGLVAALAFGVYTVVIVYTVCELPLFAKVAVVAIANFFGVFVVKTMEHRSNKDKLWKVEATVNAKKANALGEHLQSNGIQFCVMPIISANDATKDYVVFNIYCPTKTDSIIVKEELSQIKAKFFVNESKDL